jgi:hypothetical protein
MSREMGGGGRGGSGSGGISVRSKSVDAGTKRMVKKQNKAADSYKIKDLDALEKGRIARQKAKLAAEAAAKKQSNKDKVKGAAAATAGIAGGLAVVGGAKAKADSKTTPKATPKATAKPKPKLSKSEKAFLAGQKLKKKITKKTGVYPNTAN